MKKISIIGISGTGKSYLARKIGDKLNISVYHYDSICWKENWVEEKEEIVGKKIQKIINTNNWIFEGYINPLSQERLQKSDTIIYLDFHGYGSLFGGFQRYMRYKNKNRPEIAKGCIEKLDFGFLKTMLLRKERPEIEKEIAGFENKIIKLRSRRAVKKYINSL